MSVVHRGRDTHLHQRTQAGVRTDGQKVEGGMDSSVLRGPQHERGRRKPTKSNQVLELKMELRPVLEGGPM